MYEIVGKMPVSYFSAKKQAQVEGVTLHLTCTDTRVLGVAVKEVFVSAALGFTYDDFQLGKFINLHFGPSGKYVSYVTFLDDLI